MKYEYYAELTEKEERQERRKQVLSAIAIFGGIAFLLTAESIIELILKIIGG